MTLIQSNYLLSWRKIPATVKYETVSNKLGKIDQIFKIA